MRRAAIGLLLAGVLALAITGCGYSDEVSDTPGVGTSVTMARATWSTGWFQAEVYANLLRRLGYRVSEPAELPPEKLAPLAGRYVIRGFLAAVNTLDVYYQDGALYTDGQDDTSGELFPPYRASLHYGSDGRFRWSVWPAIIEFHQGERLGEVTMVTPGGAVYQGERIGEARPI